MSQPVEITFDCVPLRTVGRVDIPLDASHEYRALCERVKQALSKHGVLNTYFLHNARCTYRLTNRQGVGHLEFRFEGTVLTDPTDTKTVGSDLDVELGSETCDWLTAPIVTWFQETVRQAVMIEFDRYIEAGDLAATLRRIAQLEEESDRRGGFLGMGL